MNDRNFIGPEVGTHSNYSQQMVKNEGLSDSSGDTMRPNLMMRD